MTTGFRHPRWIQLFTNVRSWRIVFLTVLVLSVGWLALSRIPPQAKDTTDLSNPEVGFAAPAFRLQTFDGKFVTLSDVRGKIVVVNFWASWCPPCRAEMPALNQVFQHYRDAGFIVMAVNTTYQDDETTARTFYQNLGLMFPALLDRDGIATRSYQVQAFPTSFFIDRQGIVRDIAYGGPMTEAFIASKVEQLLSNKD